MAYKERVPVCGAIIISEYWDKVSLLLVGLEGLPSSHTFCYAGTIGEGMDERFFLVISSGENQQGGT
jgi:hypothetical protein